MVLPPAPQKPLSRDQERAWRAFRELLSTPAVADGVYNSLPESRNGHIISTDIARHLDARYRRVPPGRPRDLDPGDDLAWRYSWDRLEREIGAPDGRRLIRFMAGGWAAGKTHALEHARSTPDLVWDGTLKDTAWAAAMIDLALEKGWFVEIAYVFRDLEMAFYGAIERAGKEGRSVPLSLLPGIHCAVQRSVRDLSRLFVLNERVAFLFLHNVGTTGIPVEPLDFTQNDLEAGGALHYGSSHERYYTQAAAGFAKAEVESHGLGG